MATATVNEPLPHPKRKHLVIALAALTVALGTTAALSANHARSLTTSKPAQNGALSDNGRTAEVKGQITTAVNSAFSYNYADVAKTEKAAQEVLTGKAVQQYNQMFALVRQQAPQQKQILTTTVTESAVKSLKGNQARVLVFADQRNTRTDKGKSAYSAAVFAVDAIQIDGKWKITEIDTLTNGQ